MDQFFLIGNNTDFRHPDFIPEVKVKERPETEDIRQLCSYETAFPDVTSIVMRSHRDTERVNMIIKPQSH